MKTIIKAYHKNSDVLAYRKYESGGILCEYIYNENGKPLNFVNSNGYSCEYTYNENGNRIAYKNSDGCYEIKSVGNEVTKEEYEDFMNQLNPVNLDGKKVKIDGIKYELKL